MNAVPATLVCADTQFPHLAVHAMRRSLAQCRFAAAKLFTDAAGAREAAGLDAEVVVIPTLASSFDYSRFMLKELLPHVATDFVQVIQWDGFVLRGDAWSADYLAYDYVGAPWWFREAGRNVGNGGFSLRSRRLLEALQDPEIAARDPEDNVICIEHRDRLEARHGIRFAPTDVAKRYAFEGEWPTGVEFGFHRVFNLPYAMGPEELAATLAALPEGALCQAVFVTLVTKLAAVGRKGEALALGRRIDALDRVARRLGEESRKRLSAALEEPGALGEARR